MRLLTALALAGASLANSQQPVQLFRIKPHVHGDNELGTMNILPPGPLPPDAKPETVLEITHDSGAIAQNAASISFAFLPEGGFNATRTLADSVGGGMKVWNGGAQDNPATRVSLVSTDTGALYGQVWVNNGEKTTQYTIKPVEGRPGNALFYETNIPNLPELDVVVPPRKNVTQPAKRRRQTATDDGSVVDVMVLWTPAVQSLYGETTMKSMIASAIADFNLALTNSQVNLRINLVWSQMVTYTETGNMGDALDKLTTKGDGVLDNVHTLRHTYKADLVQLIVNDQNACGLGYLMDSIDTSFEEYAFSVAYVGCMGLLTPAHEFGHNMGLNHDRSASDGGAFPYSNGHRYCTGNSPYRTVMSYSCSNVYAPRVPYFSNPDISFNNLPTGVPETDPASANNVKTLTLTQKTVANFRVSTLAATPRPAAPTNVRVGTVSSTSIEISWSAVTGATAGYKIFRSNNNGVDWTQVAVNSFGTNVYLSTGLTSKTTYSYKVRSMNSAGESDDSAVVSATTPAPPPPPPPPPVFTRPPLAPAKISTLATGVSSIKITWTDVGGESGYVIYRSSNNGITWAKIADVAPNTVQYTDTALAPNTMYRYRIVAFNPYGISGPATSANTRTMAKAAAPVNLKASPAMARTLVINVSWTRNKNGINTNYELYRSADSDPKRRFVKIATLAPSATLYVDRSVTMGTGYTYQVKALSAFTKTTDNSALVSVKARRK